MPEFIGHLWKHKKTKCVKMNGVDVNVTRYNEYVGIKILKNLVLTNTLKNAEWNYLHEYAITLSQGHLKLFRKPWFFPSCFIATELPSLPLEHTKQRSKIFNLLPSKSLIATRILEAYHPCNLVRWLVPDVCCYTALSSHRRMPSTPNEPWPKHDWAHDLFLSLFATAHLSHAMPLTVKHWTH